MRVWDAMMYNGESDLLDVHLATLDPVVDRFLIVEARQTFTGRPKASTLESERHRLEPYGDKVVYECVDLPEEGSAWDRENFQRAVFRRHLDQIGPSDAVLLCDVDEIAYPHVLSRLREADPGAPIRLVLDYSLYYADLRAPMPWYNGPLWFRADMLDEPMVRVQLGEPHSDWDGYRELRLADAGVHYSFLGGVGFVQAKLSAYSHQEMNRPEIRAEDHLRRCLKMRIQLAGEFTLRQLRTDQLDPVTASLGARHPEFLASGPMPLRRSRAYAGLTRLRRHRRLPAPAGRFIDDHAEALLRVLSLPLSGVGDLVERRSLARSRAKAEAQGRAWTGLRTE